MKNSLVVGGGAEQSRRGVVLRGFRGFRWDVVGDRGSEVVPRFKVDNVSVPTGFSCVLGRSQSVGRSGARDVTSFVPHLFSPSL